MNKTNPNDCAFASDVSLPEGVLGLTKREYFAAMAMQGLLTTLPSGVPRDIEEQVAKTSVLMADALIKQLNQQQ